MKKRWLFILTVLMIAATMFVACNSDIADTKVSAQSGKELVYATFGNSSSKALTVNYDFIDYTKLYWFYQATKEDHYGTTGEVIGNNWAKVPGDSEGKGLDGTVGPFSQGLWSFNLAGYETRSTTKPTGVDYIQYGDYYYSGLVYSGASIGTVSLKYGDSNAIPVTVQPYGNTGKIYLDHITYAWDNSSAATGTVTLQIKITPVSGTPWTDSKEWVYDSGYTLTGHVLNSDSGVEIPTGTYNLDFTVCAIVDNDVAYEFAKQSLSLTVFGSQTTTVTGSLKEGLVVENAHFVATDVEVTIGTEKETMSLVEFAKKVNDGEDGYSTASVKLLEDVDLTGIIWDPIGTTEHPFSGSFNGQGYTISNVTSEHYSGLTHVESTYSSRNAPFGLFGVGNRNVTVKNLNVSVYVNEYDEFIGGVMGVYLTENNDTQASYDVIFENIIVEGVLAGKKKMGGILGSTYNDDLDKEAKNKSIDILFKNCVNNAKIDGERVGGIAGTISGFFAGDYAKNNEIKVSFSNCRNDQVEIVGTGSTYKAGGIAGFLCSPGNYSFNSCSSVEIGSGGKLFGRAHYAGASGGSTEGEQKERADQLNIKYIYGLWDTYYESTNYIQVVINGGAATYFNYTSGHAREENEWRLAINGKQYKCTYNTPINDVSDCTEITSQYLSNPTLDEIEYYWDTYGDGSGYKVDHTAPAGGGLPARVYLVSTAQEI